LTSAPQPLPYHLQIASRLQSLEPASWASFADAAARPRVAPPSDTDLDDDADDRREPGEDLELALLRHSYKLERAGHARPHEAADRAALALGLQLPISIFQLEGREGANAGLFFRPDELVIGLSGNIISLLTDDELAGVFGHELAHHLLWTAESGRLFVASRLLDAFGMYPQTPAVYLETARRFDLATELFADRCGLLAAGDLGAAVSGLVKVATGLGEVDPAAFLAQAVAAKPSVGSDGATHPETSLRAWALSEWQEGRGDEAAESLLSPGLDVERLDLLDRERLELVTKTLISDLLAVDWLRTDDVVSHARQFFPTIAIEPTSAVDSDRRRSGRRRTVVREALLERTQAPAPIPVGSSSETKRYLAYVLLDFATADAELEDEPLVEAIVTAGAVGLEKQFEQIGKRELGLADRAWSRLAERAKERVVVPGLDPESEATPDGDPPAATAEAAES
jgi:hypothetical protein